MTADHDPAANTAGAGRGDAIACATQAYAHYQRGDVPEAIALLERAISLAPGDARLQYDLATVLRTAGQLDRSIAHYRRALELAPAYPAALNNLGMSLQESGNLAQARDCFRRAIAIDPTLGGAHYNLALLNTYRPDDPHVRAMVDLATGGLPVDRRAPLLFALAKALDDLGDYETAFRWLHEAHRLQKNQTRQDTRAQIELHATLERSFDSAFFDAPPHTHATGPAVTPILIVGMPRSGSTLVERILSSHSQVRAAGEVTDLPALLAPWLEQVRHGRFPRRESLIDSRGAGHVASTYLAALHRHTASACYVTDKNLFNFRFLGFLRAILPGAIVVHCTRDPVDTCVSCYKRLFDGGVGFAHDLRELGEYYRSYAALMAHWSRVAPVRLLDVRYETLIADPEAVVREVLAHCGLAWEPACLRFHERSDAVRTASLAQVRRPIYRTAVGTSHKYRAFIGPLLEALDG